MEINAGRAAADAREGGDEGLARWVDVQIARAIPSSVEVTGLRITTLTCRRVARAVVALLENAFIRRRLGANNSGDVRPGHMGVVTSHMLLMLIDPLGTDLVRAQAE